MLAYFNIIIVNCLLAGIRVDVGGFPSRYCYFTQYGNLTNGCVDHLHDDEIESLHRAGYTDISFKGKICYCDTDLCNQGDKSNRIHVLLLLFMMINGSIYMLF